MLVHYDTHKLLVLACDASLYVGGADLTHVIMGDGSKKSIGYVSWMLSPAGERTRTAWPRRIVHCNWCHQVPFIFMWVTIHIYVGHLAPFFQTTGLSWGNNKAIPVMASARIHRWAVTQSAYLYMIPYKSGSEMCNADAVSRLPAPADPFPQGVPSQ